VERPHLVEIQLQGQTWPETLLHQAAFTPGRFYTKQIAKQLFLHKPIFTPNNFCPKQHVQKQFLPQNFFTPNSSYHHRVPEEQHKRSKTTSETKRKNAVECDQRDHRQT